MSSTNFGSILIFASCVVGTRIIVYYVGKFFRNGRGYFLLLKKHIYIYTYCARWRTLTPHKGNDRIA